MNVVAWARRGVVGVAAALCLALALGIPSAGPLRGSPPPSEPLFGEIHWYAGGTARGTAGEIARGTAREAAQGAAQGAAQRAAEALPYIGSPPTVMTHPEPSTGARS